jgi:hypothetical protein
MPLVAGGALALLLLAGVGGWLAFRDRGTKVNPSGPEVAKPKATAASNVAPNATPNVSSEAPKVEAASYWFEAFDKPEDETGRRVAEPAATLVSGQRFRFHFKPAERGYLYIIGPGEGGNAQTILLTAQGAGPLKTNLVGAGADFAFPSWTKLKLDVQPGADEFTFIFSTKPLNAPAFLAGKFMHALTTGEVSELEEFRSQFKSDAPAVSVGGDDAERRVVVNAPATTEGRPLIFDVRINHK